MMNTSELLGYVSIACWLGAQFPQVIMNWRNQSVDGLALPFLVNWLLGDISNLIGCLLTNQLMFQTILASYFCAVDFTLFAQFFYYDFFRPAPPKRLRRRLSASYVSAAAGRRSFSVDRVGGDHLHALSVAAQGVAQAAQALEEDRRARTHRAGGPRSRRSASHLTTNAELSMSSHARAVAATHPRSRMHSHDTTVDAQASEAYATAGGMDSSQVSEASARRVTWSESELARSPSRSRGAGHSPSRAFGPRNLTRGESSSSLGSAHLHAGQHQHSHPHLYVPQLSVISATPLPSASPLTDPNYQPDDDGQRLGFTHNRDLSQSSLTERPDGRRGRSLGPAGSGIASEEDALTAMERMEKERDERERKRRSSRASRRSASIVFMGVWALVGLNRMSRRSADGEVLAAADVEAEFSFDMSQPVHDAAYHHHHTSEGSFTSARVTFESTHPDDDEHDEPPPGPIPGEGVSMQRLIGRISAWTCTTLYLTSRLPQIWKNFVRKSCEGLSMALFTFAFLGNFFYVLSIAATPFDSKEKRLAFLKESVPYLLGSGGTLVFDVTIVIQSFVYAPTPGGRRGESSSKRGGEEEEGLLAHGGVEAEPGVEPREGA